MSIYPLVGAETELNWEDAGRVHVVGKRTNSMLFTKSQKKSKQVRK